MLVFLSFSKEIVLYVYVDLVCLGGSEFRIFLWKIHLGLLPENCFLSLTDCNYPLSPPNLQQKAAIFHRQGYMPSFLFNKHVFSTNHVPAL